MSQSSCNNIRIDQGLHPIHLLYNAKSRVPHLLPLIVSIDGWIDWTNVIEKVRQNVTDSKGISNDCPLPIDEKFICRYHHIVKGL